MDGSSCGLSVRRLSGAEFCFYSWLSLWPFPDRGGFSIINGASLPQREHLRLARGEYRFSDQLRELFLGRTRTWAEIESAWKCHEQALVDLGFMQRVEYYARRGSVPSKANPEFARAIQQMDEACPWWLYRVSQTGASITITATPKALEFWKNLVPSAGLQEDKPKKEGRRRSKKCGRRPRARDEREHPVGVDWYRLFPDRLAPVHQ